MNNLMKNMAIWLVIALSLIGGVSGEMWRADKDGARGWSLVRRLALRSGACIGCGLSTMMLLHANGVSIWASSAVGCLTAMAGADVAIVDINDPSHIRTVNLGLFGLFGFPDDLTVGPDGLIYLAMDGGDIVRIDPDRHAACILASGMFGSTSVRLSASTASGRSLPALMLVSDEDRLSVIACTWPPSASFSAWPAPL